MAKVFFLLVLFMFFMGGPEASAVPTRNEVYRSDKLHTIVYKDGQDNDVFWYLPPVKLYENDGKVVYYKRQKEDRVSYFFYIVPYMTDDLIELLAGEIAGLQNKSQLRPVIARKFGIQVKQFNAVAMGEELTDYQYLNHPQLITVTLPLGDAEEFEFFIQNKPGVQANVLFHFDSERMDKYLTIELTYKEVYNALNVAATGKYQFTRAEIESGITDYVSKKYFNMKSKGDLPIPDIINKVIEECFTPYKKPDPKKTTPGNWDDWLLERLSPVCSNNTSEKGLAIAEACQSQLDTYNSLGGDWDAGDDTDWSGGSRKKKEPDGVQFTLKKDIVNSDKTLFYKQEHYADSSEIAGVPLYISLSPEAAKTKVLVTPLLKKDFVVEATHDKVNPYRSAITVNPGEQYIITAVFALAARSAYQEALRWYRWDGKWPNADEELYYRIGTGPWMKVAGRTILKTDAIYKGELQFALDRDRIWEKIPKEYKNSKMLGVVPAIFTYKQTFPQFNVVVNGRKVEVR